jgi:pimeloyl-ACP methyl ester carboxylesterase
VPEVSVPAPVDGLDALLSTRLRRAPTGGGLERRTATVLLDCGDAGSWTVRLDHGRAGVRRGATPTWTLRVRTTAAVLADVVSGTASAVLAFLDGRLAVRGDLSLAMSLDGLFSPEVPDGRPRSREVEAMGVRTSYLEAGPADGPPVVLLHGLGATGASMLPVLADLMADHRVLAPDSPGFGASDAPRGPYTPAWFAAWVEAFQRATGSRGAVLVGNSLGGRIALEAGLTRPQSVRAVVLLAPSPAFRRLRQYVPFVRLVTPQLASLPVLMHSRMAAEGLKAMFSDPSRLPDTWFDAFADETVRVLADRAHRVAFFSCARQIYLEDAYGRDGFWQRLPGLLPPALFVWGDRDRLVPSSFARHVADALPSAGQVVLEDCGHVPHFEHPLETMAMLRGFLEHVPER